MGNSCVPEEAPPKMRLLLLVRPESMTEEIGALLTDTGHDFEWHPTPAAVGTAAAFDAWLVDADAPAAEGVGWIGEQLRAGTVRPVMLLSSRPCGAKRLRELNCGPRDCLVKPVDPDRIMARLQAWRRRDADPAAYRVRIGDALIDLDRQLVEVNGRAVQLTVQEWQVFERLADQPGATVSKSELAARGGLPSPSNKVEFHVSRLRRKLGRWSIETIRGRGYRLVP